MNDLPTKRSSKMKPKTLFVEPLIYLTVYESYEDARTFAHAVICTQQ